MLLGVAAIASSSASGSEQALWRQAAQREADRYGIAKDYVEARMHGRSLADEKKRARSVLDWVLVVGATSIFVILATMARLPQIPANWAPAIALAIASLALFLICGLALYRTTRFH